MNFFRLIFLLTLLLVTQTVTASETINTVINIDSKTQNISFTLDQPVVIVDSKKPVSIVFQRNEQQLLVVELCDYSPPTNRSPCYTYQTKDVPYYVFARYGISMRVSTLTTRREIAR